jgi:multisubunit Na+/H+ antiporter MnhB subunit
VIATHSPIVRLAIQAASPLALVVAVFLFFAGHNRPGGGFAAGLVLGAVVALRAVAGLEQPFRALGLLATGGVVAGAVSLAPVVAGGILLDQAVTETTVPLLGTVKSGTALVFDAGVTLIVVGLVVAVLDGLGATELATVDREERG